MMDEDDLDECDPYILNEDFDSNLKSFTGQNLDKDDVAFPCGRIAKYYFNDQF